MVMTWIFIVLTHAVILAGMLGIFYFVYRLIQNDKELLENVIRTAAALTGFLIYFGSKAIGISIPTFMMSSVATTNPYTFGFMTIIAPSAAGVFVAWYTIKSIRQSEDLASRVVILITTFILVMFADVYAATYQVELDRSETMKALVPNLTFTVAICLYLIFRYQRPKKGT